MKVTLAIIALCCGSWSLSALIAAFFVPCPLAICLVLYSAMYKFCLARLYFDCHTLT